jgi:outer membrane protein TolC
MRARKSRLLIATALAVAVIAPKCSPAGAQAPQAPAPLPATTTPAVYRLTLEQARERALTNNKALTLARINTEVSRHATAAATKDYFPKFIASDTYFHFDRPLGSVVTAGRGVFFPAREINANVLNQNSNLATAFVAQPITKLIAVNALVQISRADEDIARAKLDQGTRDLLSGVSQAYYGLLGAQRIEKALELQVQVLDQALAAKPSAEMRVVLLKTREELLTVRGQAKELTDQLNSLLDLPACTVLELADPVPPLPPVRCADEAARMAVSCNGDVREAEANIAKAEAALKVAKMDYLPDVNVIGGWGNQTGASYIQDNFGYVGVTGSYTLWEWGKRRDVMRQRETQIMLARQNLEVTRDKVELAARKAYNAFEQALEAYRLSGEIVQARKEVEKGAPNPLEAATAKGATVKAELEYMQAEITYRVAHAQLMGVLCCE